MATEAYGDYRQRLHEATALIRVAEESHDLATISGCSKAAVVLSAAAAEQYINTAIHKICLSISAHTWATLPEGTSGYLTKQIAKHLSEVVGPILTREDLPTEAKRDTLSKAVAEGNAAFQDPSSWRHHTRFGLFKTGQDATGRVSGVLRQFSQTGRDPYEKIDEIGWSRADLLLAFKQLVDARHSIAHALPGGVTPSPEDAKKWLCTTFWLIRRIDSFVSEELQSAP